MAEEAESSGGGRRATEPQAAPERGGGFASTRSYALLAYLATRRWPRFFGYGLLIVACRVVRTAIRA